jgi:hypothetical protein
LLNPKDKHRQGRMSLDLENLADRETSGIVAAIDLLVQPNPSTASLLAR